VRIGKFTDGGDCRLHDQVSLMQTKAARQWKPQITQRGEDFQGHISPIR
jgi:hypothetical protein